MRQTGPEAMGVAMILHAHGQDPPVQLTLRETQVVRLVARGLTTQQIARRLGLSMRTIDNHIGRAMRRTASPSRAALVSWAHRHEMVS